VFGLPFAGAALSSAAAAFPVLTGMGKAQEEMCQGCCSVGLSLDHRSTKTGARRYRNRISFSRRSIHGIIMAIICLGIVRE
jgi:hypothetical protein